jgi:outer membrane murein-binding lipoprotein Lpp
VIRGAAGLSRRDASDWPIRCTAGRNQIVATALLGWNAANRNITRSPLMSLPKITPAVMILAGSLALGGCATKGYVNDQIASVNQRIDGLEGRLQSTDTQVQAAQAAAQAASGQAQQANQRIDQLNSRVDSLEQRMTQRQARN